MAHRANRGRHFSGSVKRQTAWDGAIFGQETIGAIGSELHTTGITPTVDGLTLIRLRGELIVTALMNAATDLMVAATGIILVSSEAFAAGVASVLSPITDIEDDWLFHQWHSVQSGVLGGSGLGTEMRFEIDNKAMRRFPIGKVLCAVLEVSAETGTVQMDTIFNLRALVKLP